MFTKGARGHTHTHTLPGGIGWLHLMRVAPVRPEDQEAVKDGLNVGHDRPPLWVDLEDAAMDLVKSQKGGSSLHNGSIHREGLQVSHPT